MSRAEEPVSHKDGWASTLPNDDILIQWKGEMSDCQKVDPEERWGYYNLSSELTAVLGNRETAFLMEHNLYGQYRKEMQTKSAAK